MKIIGAYYDFGFFRGDALHLISPLARCLDRGLNRLRTRVHRKHHIEAGQIVKLFTKQRKLLVAKCAGSERDFLSLLFQSLQDLGVTMPLVDRGIRGQAIKITPPLDVIHPYSFRALDHHIERMIRMRSVPVFKFYIVLRA